MSTQAGPTPEQTGSLVLDPPSFTTSLPSRNVPEQHAEAVWWEVSVGVTQFTKCCLPPNITVLGEVFVCRAEGKVQMLQAV